MPENEPAAVEVEGATPEVAELGEKGVAALKAERAARKSAEKALDDLAAKVKAFEDRDKSEGEKLKEQLAELSGRAAKAERENARLAVIAKHQVPEEYHDLVWGDDEEALAASAQKVRSLIDSTATKDRASFVIPDEGGSPALALNGDGLEAALKKALGIA